MGPFGKFSRAFGCHCGDRAIYSAIQQVDLRRLTGFNSSSLLRSLLKSLLKSWGRRLLLMHQMDCANRQRLSTWSRWFRSLQFASDAATWIIKYHKCRISGHTAIFFRANYHGNKDIHRAQSLRCTMPPAITNSTSRFILIASLVSVISVSLSGHNELHNEPTTKLCLVH